MAKRMMIADSCATVADDVIMDQIDRGSRVIDLGCGDGRLLSKLRDEKGCDILGAERDHGAFLQAVARGVPMLKADLNRGLHEIPAGCFDFAVLSQTLQQVSRPLELLDEILRVARRALIVVPNFGHWRVRLQVAIRGRAPVTDSLPYEWYESPNVHFLTMLDFRDLARHGNFRIVKELPIIGQRAVERAWAANLRANSALYILERAHGV
jgi:methionine biosynthesis protein MetW